MPSDERPDREGFREGLKEWLELAENMDDIPRDGVEVVNYAMPTGRPLWQLYRGGRIPCHIHIEVNLIGQSATHYLCATFERLRGSHEVQAHSPDALKGGVLKRESPAYGDESRVHHTVLVRVGEVLEDGEGMLTEVPSVVRLVDVNHCPMLGRDVLQSAAFPQSSGVAVPGGSVVERES